MDEALAHWLALREAIDVDSRHAGLAARVIETLPSDVVRVLDLGTGAGSNVRYLLPRLPARQRWLVTDRSHALLTHLQNRTAAWATARQYMTTFETAGLTIAGTDRQCHLTARAIDLDTLPGELFTGQHLVTASALLDLVSDQWLDILAAQARDAGAALLFTITYNGQSACTPVEPEDEWVRALVNAHQLTDKGLGGPAAGPGAVATAVQRFIAAGFVVEQQPSPWLIPPQAGALQCLLVEGWAAAAAEMAPADAAQIADWCRRRLEHVSSGRSSIIVGHDDIGAWLPR